MALRSRPGGARSNLPKRVRPKGPARKVLFMPADIRNLLSEREGYLDGAGSAAEKRLVAAELKKIKEVLKGNIATPEAMRQLRLYLKNLEESIARDETILGKMSGEKADALSRDISEDRKKIARIKGFLRYRK